MQRQPTSTADVIDSLNRCNDLVTWINDILGRPTQEELGNSSERPTDLTELEQRLSNLVTTVEIACEDTSSQLERIIDDVSRGVPRLTYDLHYMKDGALSLQAALAKVHEKSDSMPKTTASALDRLQYLDTVKRNMEAARDVLREAESWSALEMEVTTLLSDRSYAKAAERLSEANRSMAVFENTPEYDSRRTLMVSLQNQLEASLSSALVAAISSQDMSVCRDYFSIFVNIQRESEFRNYYSGSRRAPVVSMWKDVHLDCEAYPTSSTQTFSEFLPKFYASFLTLLDAERTSIPSIFPDPPLTMSTLISSVLSALQPTFPQRLASILNHYGAFGLRELIAAFRATKEFAAATEKIIEKISIPVPAHSTWDPPSDGAQLKKSHSRRRSTRMSMSWRSGAPLPSALLNSNLEWDQDLFQPFLDFQSDYGSLEKRFLDDVLSEIVNAGEVMVDSDRARLLRERSVDIYRAGEDAMARCMAFTHGYGAVGLVQALDHFFKSFMDMWTADIASQRSSSVPITSLSASGEDLSDLDYTEQDWSDFQLSIHLLAAARAVFERISSFESKLRSALVQIATTFRMARSDPTNFSILDMTNGEGMLLAQSTLNSAELYSLLENVETETSTSGPSTFPSSSSSAPAPARQPHVGSPAPLLVDARSAVSSFSQACQVSLQETILSPLRRHLAMYSSLPLWSTQSDTRSRRTGPNDLQVPSFSLSPTEIVQRVAEGILNLPRLFEVYADDDALSFSLQTLPYVDAELLKGLSEQSLSAVEPQTPARRTSFVAAKSTQSFLTPEAVSSAWLSSLGYSAISHFTTNVMPNIRTLTTAGAAQLAADLAYLSNIVRALNVEHEDLERWKEYTEMDDETGKRKVVDRELSDPIFGRVARMRGWNA